MGRQILSKRRRVLSLDPNKLAYSMFARNYVRYLITSLAKISSNPSHHHQQKKFQELVKFEVDMAMAESAASEFAWGNALKKKLLQRDQLVGNNGNNNGGFDFSLQTVKFSQENLEREEEEDQEEEKKMENGLMKLRKILPGGSGDDDDSNNGGDLEEDDLLKQTESYIKCLELQVNVLRCLVDNTNTN